MVAAWRKDDWRGVQGQDGAAGRRGHAGAQSTWIYLFVHVLVFVYVCVFVCVCVCVCVYPQGPDWANFEVQLADELHEISKKDRGAGQGGGRGGGGSSQGHELDEFVVEAASAYLDTSFGALEESALAGRKEEEGELALEHAERIGIMLHYDTAESPTVLDVGSEIPPGVVRFLGTTKNGGWRNPAKHSARTGVQILKSALIHVLYI